MFSAVTVTSASKQAYAFVTVCLFIMSIFMKFEGLVVYDISTKRLAFWNGVPVSSGFSPVFHFCL